MIDNAIILNKEEYENVKNNIRNSAYQKGAREFAEWLLEHPLLNGFDEEYFYTIRDCQMTVDEVLAEWQKEGQNAKNI